MARDTSFYTEIKQKVDLDDYLTEHLGVELVSDGPGRWAACCPFHSEDTPSFKVEESDEGWKRWWCYGSCQTGGTVIDAVMRAEKFSEANEAAEYLNDLFDLGLDMHSEAYLRFKKTVAETKADQERTQAAMADPANRAAKVAKSYLDGRGFTAETIEHFALGVDTKNTKAGRLSIPLIDKANHPVSIANRALFDSHPCATCKEPVKAKDVRKRQFQAKKAEERGGEVIDWKACPHCGAEDKEAKISFLIRQDPKYLFTSDFDKANLLYHENHARPALMKDPESLGLFLTEGQADTWAGWQAGQRAFCAYFGAVLSEWQAEEAAELAMAAEKPVILVPDFDATGQHNIDANIRKLRKFSERVEIQVVHGLDRLDPPCKDLGEVLQKHGTETVARILKENRWPAAEWQIRKIVEQKLPNSEEPFWSKVEQMERVAEVLANVTTRESLDHIIPYLAGIWNIQEQQVRQYFYSKLSSTEATSAQHLFKDIVQAQAESALFLADGNVIPLGFDDLDSCFPGGGVRPGQLMMMLGKSGTGKTMLASQMLANMADRDVNTVFFSLEQGAGTFYPRLACQALDRSPEEVEEMIKNDDPELEKVRELYRNMYLIDNVPTDTQDAIAMTPGKVQSIIQEANLTHFEGRPVDVVIIDHLGILEVSEDAPADVRKSETAAPGHIMKELFAVCKATKVFMIVLQQLPKDIPAGEPFGMDAGWGGSQQTNYCDYICQIWRPEQKANLDETERLEVEGQYKLALGKNRFGPGTLAHLFFDKSSLRILPPLKISQPKVNEDGTLDFDSDEIMFGAPPSTQPEVGSEIGLTAEGLRVAAESHPDPTPRDTNELLKAIGAVADDDEDPFGDDSMDPFTIS